VKLDGGNIMDVRKKRTEDGRPRPKFGHD